MLIVVTFINMSHSSKQAMSLLILSILIILRFVGLGRSGNCVGCTNYGTVLTCDPQTCDRQLSNGYWAGNITEGGDILVGRCPRGYCLYNESGQSIQISPGADQTIGDFLCNSTRRMGIICSQCQPGNAPAINSGGAGYASECVPCDGESSMVNWLLYLLVIYVPLLVVFLVIIVFNIRLTTGPVNSFILFAQLISTTLDINHQGVAPLNVVYGVGTRAFEKSYQIPYNFFNLNFFGNLVPPFCLHEKMNSSDAMMLRYIEGFFPVLIIIAILLLLRCQRCLKVCDKLPSFCGSHCRKYRIGTSLVHAFAAFVLLSYNLLCQTSAYLLSTVRLRDSSLKAVEERIFFQADYSSWNFDYVIRYKISAYLVTFFLVAAPIVLLHYPMKWVERLVSKVSCLRNVYPSASIAILLDTFQGCFKDNRRYFAGLYLALRLLLFYAYLLPILLNLLVQQAIFIIYIFLFAVLKPYKDNRLNILDIAIFTNMALINILTWYTIDKTFHTDSASLSACIIIESILVFLPMVYLVAFLLWYCAIRYHGGASAKMTKWRDSVKKCLRSGAGEEDDLSTLPPLYSPSERSKFYTVIENSLPQERERSY